MKVLGSKRSNKQMCISKVDCHCNHCLNLFDSVLFFHEDS